MLNVVDLILPDWETVYRLIPSHFPPISLFEEVADPNDFDLIYAIESLTNDRLLDEVGDLSLVANEDRICGPGSTPIMAAFTHIGIPSRFTDGSYGVYYAAKELKTAIKETVYHREVFLRKTNESDTELTMRCYANKIAVALHDVRAKEHVGLHSEDYTAPQQFAALMRKQGSPGLVYRSVRDAGGECIAAFKPKSITIPVQAGHYKYLWKHRENKISEVLKIEKVDF